MQSRDVEGKGKERNFGKGALEKNKGCLGWVLQIEGLEARQDMV